MQRKYTLKPCAICGTEIRIQPSLESRKKYCSRECLAKSRAKPALPLNDRFWSKVNKTDGCWIWTAYRNRLGYGYFATGSRQSGDRKRHPAHRISYEMTYGEIPDGLFVCHSCDNPSCVRPDHLFIGTQMDNVKDMIQKGRGAFGDKHPSHLRPETRATGERHGTKTHPESIVRGEDSCKSVLCEADVLAIRARYAQGNTSHAKLAKEYNVSNRAIQAIVTRESWKHLTD